MRSPNCQRFHPSLQPQDRHTDTPRSPIPNSKLKGTLPSSTLPISGLDITQIPKYKTLWRLASGPSPRYAVRDAHGSGTLGPIHDGDWTKCVQWEFHRSASLTCLISSASSATCNQLLHQLFRHPPTHLTHLFPPSHLPFPAASSGCALALSGKGKGKKSSRYLRKKAKRCVHRSSMVLCCGSALSGPLSQLLYMLSHISQSAALCFGVSYCVKLRC